MDTLSQSDLGDDRKVFNRAVPGGGHKASGSRAPARAYQRGNGTKASGSEASCGQSGRGSACRAAARHISSHRYGVDQ